MKIAISTEGDSVSMHFGRCPSFTIVDIESGKLISKSSLNNPGHEMGAIPKFLNEHGVNCIVAGGMGGRAQTFFQEFNIETVIGANGKIDDVIEKLKKEVWKAVKAHANRETERVMVWTKPIVTTTKTIIITKH